MEPTRDELLEEIDRQDYQIKSLESLANDYRKIIHDQKQLIEEIHLQLKEKVEGYTQVKDENLKLCALCYKPRSITGFGVTKPKLVTAYVLMEDSYGGTFSPDLVSTVTLNQKLAQELVADKPRGYTRFETVHLVSSIEELDKLHKGEQ